MNLNELSTIIRHIRKTTTCPGCNKRYNFQDISIIASTKFECLLELRCDACKKSSLTDIVATPKNRNHGGIETKIEVPLINQIIRDGITDNDILDIKNFLNSFDGDFKKLFHV